MSTPSRNETIVKHDSRIHSATATQYRFTLHIPLNDNEGNPFDSLTLGRIESSLLTSFGAFTVVDAHGVWQDGNVTYLDVQRLYHIDVSDDSFGFRLRELAAEIRNTLGQECVYVTRQTIDTWLV